ncbi:MAG: FAD-dependent hydroxylase [Leptolyngbyaceae cyanobacterium SM1_1_3]|nr:FAD-dependent hydroxylase [Leptolyngbyaceae cyanobacterium SM1_1_3]NJN04182.1 FAD-dependent hydroxylase [Leptolyngbyaceae cyanobacterium RM1_1_2]NJO08609.1 FAD-dependent hydroxylase [Leptolyngbyaceae cyanobacterium SL_1_1]
MTLPSPTLLPNLDHSQKTIAEPKPVTTDVAIVGGGIVGLTLACALKNSGLSVTVIESQSWAQAADRPRAYAMSLLSGQIFAGLGLWDEISPQVTHFQSVRLSDANHPQTVEFLPTDLQTSAVYYAAEHGVLMQALQRQVRQCNHVAVMSLARLRSVTYHPNGVRLEIDAENQTYQLAAKLVVAADGARSRLRQQANIGTQGWRYWQSCITAVLAPEKSHQNTAYERFWPDGPFAILPLPSGRCQIVWTMPHAEAEAIMALPKEQFMAELSQRYGDQMGHLELVNEPLLFPVQLMQSLAYMKPQLALIGDAAHCCHPVGGQGLNMGIRDAAALAQVLQAAHRRGEAIGSGSVLKRYQRWRRLENFVVLAFTDILNRTFSNQCQPLVWLRRRGLWVLQHVLPVKQLALRLMTGLLGKQPAIAAVQKQR